MLRLSQLQSASPPSGFLAEMCLDDANGNRTSFSVTGAGCRERGFDRQGHDNGPLSGTYTYAQDSNRLLGIAGTKNVQLSYTANGNL